MRLLNELWQLVMLRKNHLLPCVKASGWKHTPAGRKQRVYDKPRTPYQRLLDAKVLDAKTAARLAQIHEGLNPAKITRRINKIQLELIQLAAARTQANHSAV